MQQRINHLRLAATTFALIEATKTIEDGANRSDSGDDSDDSYFEDEDDSLQVIKACEPPLNLSEVEGGPTKQPHATASTGGRLKKKAGTSFVVKAASLSDLVDSDDE